MQPETQTLESHIIEVYKPYRAQLQELKAANDSLVFDYDSAAGEKEARSYIHKLRKTKTAVDSVREAEKKVFLDGGRNVDAQAREIINEIEKMIDVHMKPIKEKEEREEKRVAMIKEKIEAVRSAVSLHKHSPSSVIATVLETIYALHVDDSYGEYFEPMRRAKNEAIEALELARTDAVKREAEKEELERLRAEMAERDKRDREAKIAAEAAARATAEAEAKAKAEREEAERAAYEERFQAEERERIHIAQKEKLERDAAAAKAQAEEQARLAIVRAEEAAARAVAEEREREEARLLAIKKKEEERAANEKHLEQVHNNIAFALIKCQVTEEAARLIIEAIRAGEVPNVKIIY